MAAQDVTDSPTGWVRDHIASYVSSAGEDGHLWRGVPSLLLTTVGRRSGAKRRTALIYGRDGADYVVVGSYGGSPTHPLWYLNLQAEPRVEVQVGAEVFTATARTADPAERARLWPELVRTFPPYEGYQARTTREVPLVLLTRV